MLGRYSNISYIDNTIHIHIISGIDIVNIYRTIPDDYCLSICNRRYNGMITRACIIGYPIITQSSADLNTIYFNDIGERVIIRIVCSNVYQNRVSFIECRTVGRC